MTDLIEKMSINWLANDGIWFQAVEKQFGMGDAKRCNDTCWTRFSPFEAARIKKLLDLPDDGGIPALKKALALRMYAFINEQSMEEVDDNCIIFYMNNCRVQAARKRKGWPIIPANPPAWWNIPPLPRPSIPASRPNASAARPMPIRTTGFAPGNSPSRSEVV